jgi:hypothetical protein
MTFSTRWTGLVAAFLLLTAATIAEGQTPADVAARSGADAPARPAPVSPWTAAAPGQFIRPSFATGAPARTLAPVKPFEAASQRPTISPYLHLYREERNDDTLPNYFAFVLPQMRQQEFYQQQQMELEEIQQQLRRTSGVLPAVAQPAAQGQPHNYQARFMNMGNFYSGVGLPQVVDGGE